MRIEDQLKELGIRQVTFNITTETDQKATEEADDGWVRTKAGKMCSIKIEYDSEIISLEKALSEVRQYMADLIS